MIFEQLDLLVNRAIKTIDGDMDFSSYTKEEKDWIYSYCIEYDPEYYSEVIKALLK